MSKKATKTKLASPAAAIIAASAVTNNKKAVTTTINVGLILLGVTVLGVAGTAFYAFYWKNRFIKKKYDASAPSSNVSPSAAKFKADALYTAMKGAGTDEKTIFQVLKGVNKNGFIAIYNAFGKREPGGVSFSLGNRNYEDLIQFLQGDLSSTDIERLRRIIGANGLF